MDRNLFNFHFLSRRGSKFWLAGCMPPKIGGGRCFAWNLDFWQIHNHVFLPFMWDIMVDALTVIHHRIFISFDQFISMVIFSPVTIYNSSTNSIIFKPIINTCTTLAVLASCTAYMYIHYNQHLSRMCSAYTPRWVQSTVRYLGLLVKSGVQGLIQEAPTDIRHSLNSNFLSPGVGGELQTLWIVQ